MKPTFILGAKMNYYHVINDDGMNISHYVVAANSEEEIKNMSPYNLYREKNLQIKLLSDKKVNYIATEDRWPLA